MNYSTFRKLAEKEMNSLYDCLEQSGFDGDFDLINDVLYIHSDQGDYVINQHSPTMQIWLSSPISNAGYFNYDQERQEWIDKHSVTLRNRLHQDLKLKLSH